MTVKILTPQVIWMAALGILSGVLSSFEIPVLGDVKLLGTPLQHGLFFALVIAFGLFRWGRAGWVGAVLALLITIAAWIAAERSFVFLTDNGSEYIAIGGFVAGAIGSAFTILGGALTIPALRQPRAWLLTITVGAIAGLLIIFPAEYIQDKWFILFVPWQCLVAASIGHALANGPSTD